MLNKFGQSLAKKADQVQLKQIYDYIDSDFSQKEQNDLKFAIRME